MAFILANPTLVNLVQRRRIEVMQLFTSTPNDGDEVRPLQYGQMLGHCLPGDVEMFTQLSQGLPVARPQLVEQLSTASVSQSFEHLVHLPDNMQPKGCMSSGV